MNFNVAFLIPVVIFFVYKAYKKSILFVCPSCGTSLDSNDKFCTNCGEENTHMEYRMTYDDTIRVGAITGAITGAIVYLGGIQWAASSIAVSIPMVDAIPFAMVGAVIGLVTGVIGSLLGRLFNELFNDKKNGIVSTIIYGVVPTVFVAGVCSFFSAVIMMQAS